MKKRILTTITAILLAVAALPLVTLDASPYQPYDDATEVELRQYFTVPLSHLQGRAGLPVAISTSDAVHYFGFEFSVRVSGDSLYYVQAEHPATGTIWIWDGGDLELRRYNPDGTTTYFPASLLFDGFCPVRRPAEVALVQDVTIPLQIIDWESVGYRPWVVSDQPMTASFYINGVDRSPWRDSCDILHARFYPLKTWAYIEPTLDMELHAGMQRDLFLHRYGFEGGRYLMERVVFELINEYRVAHGLIPWVQCDVLALASRLNIQDIYDNYDYRRENGDRIFQEQIGIHHSDLARSHIRTDGRSSATWVHDAERIMDRPPLAHVLSANSIRASTSPAAQIQAWLSNDYGPGGGSRGNLLRCYGRPRAVGIGVGPEAHFGPIGMTYLFVGVITQN